jgi:hypothetical protein
MRLSMKLYVRPVTVVGIDTARLRACAIGMSSSSSLGVGVVGCPGLRSVEGSQWHKEILFERSVTISEKLHHVGGFGEPPKDSWRARKAIPANTMIVCDAAFAEWVMRR